MLPLSSNTAAHLSPCLAAALLPSQVAASRTSQQSSQGLITPASSVLVKPSCSESPQLPMAVMHDACQLGWPELCCHCRCPAGMQQGCSNLPQGARV
jgi:hypothetical protein